MKKHIKALTQIKDIISKSKTFFIAGHLKPDGDVVGSALALSSLLKRMGKKVEIYTKDVIPDHLFFLHGICQIKCVDIVKKNYDCAIILESVNLSRMGDLITMNQAKHFINIDHHATFTEFGDANYIDPSASSSAEQVYNIFHFLKLPIAPTEAECLYVGLVTDTGKFQHSNASPEAMRMGADLISIGVKPDLISDKIYATKSYQSLKLLGLVLNTLQLDEDMSLAFMHITNTMYRKSHSSVLDTEEIINFIMMMPKVKIGVLFRESNKPNITKVSFRSRDSVSVNKIAHHYGGGGHKNAAGCTVHHSLEKTKKTVLAYIAKELKNTR